MAVAASVSAGAEAISSGSQTASAGRTDPYPAWPAGMRWKGVNVDPASVVGTAATRPPPAATTALAASTTRPPPKATTSRPATGPISAAAASDTRPAATCSSSAAASARPAGICPRARSVVSSTHSPPEAVVVQQLERLRGRPAAEADDPLAVAEDERRLGHAAGAGSVVSAGSRWSCFCPASMSAMALVRARR